MIKKSAPNVDKWIRLHMLANRRSIPLPLLYTFFVGIYSFTKGFFYPPVAIALLGFWFLTLWSFIGKKRGSKFNDTTFNFSLAASSLMSIFFYTALYQHIEFYGILAQSLYAILGILLLFLPLSRSLFIMAVTTIVCILLLTIASSPHPKIDVYDYSREGPKALIEGKNPYSIMYPKVYPDIVPDFYSYLPATLVTTLPGIILFDDPRYFLVMCLVGTVFLLQKLSPKSMQFSLPLLFLLNPMTAFVIEESYSEPLIILFFTFFFLLLSRKSYTISAIIFGLLLSMKQYVILVIPLFVFGFFPIKKRIFFVVTVIVSALFIIPFLIWSPQDFIHDAIKLQYSIPPRYEGLTFFSLTHYFFHWNYSNVLSIIIILFTYFYIYYMQRQKRLDYFSALFLLFFSFFFFNKWAFVNYYYLISFFLLMSELKSLKASI